MTAIAHDVIRRPGLAYQHAFDWLAVQLQAANGPVAYHCGTTWQSVEMVRRIPSILVWGEEPTNLASIATALGVPLVTAAESTTWPFAAVGLIEPNQVDLEFIERVRPGGRIYIATGGRLARFLNERRDGATGLTLDEPALVVVMQAAGFHVTERLGIHPPVAVLEHYSGIAAMSFGRRAARDRQHFAMLRDMVTCGSAAGMSALVCLTLERQA